MEEVWGYLDSGYGSAAFNMAMDEALLNWHSEGKIPPVIRFYAWEPAALSIGYFQSVKKEINLEEQRKLNLDIVRRPTGGRAVLHEHELTYSIIVSESHPQMPQTVTETYRVISAGLLEGFRNLGFNAYLSVPGTDEEKERLKNPQSAVCFDAPSWYELVIEGRKAAGSAQTRQKGVILQHGSILLDFNEDKLFSLFKYPNERVREKIQASFKAKAVALNQISERPVTLDEAKVAFRNGFAKALGIKLDPLKLTPGQLDQIIELMREKYDSDHWNDLR